MSRIERKGLRNQGRAPLPVVEHVANYDRRSWELDALVMKCEADIDPETELSGAVQHLATLPEEDRTFLDEFAEDEEVLAAWWLSMRSVWGMTRKGGLRYAAHPMSMVDSSLRLARDLPRESRKEMAMVELVHDVIEEDAIRAFQGKKQQQLGLVELDDSTGELEVIDQARVGLNRLLPGVNLGDAAVLMMEPVVPQESRVRLLAEGKDDYLITYGYFAEFLRRAGQPAIINSEIADRESDILDLGYITKSPKPDDEKARKLTDKLAKCWFTVEHMRNGDDIPAGISERMVNTYGQVMTHVVDNLAWVTWDGIQQRRDDFVEIVKQYQDRIEVDLDAYAENVGVSLQRR